MKILIDDLITPNLTLVASSETSGFPVTELQDPRASRKWRATDCASENVVIDLESALDVDTVCIIGHNFSEDATVTIQANSSDAWGAPPVDEEVDWKEGIIVLELSAAETYRYWRVLIEDPTNEDGYVEFGVLKLGVAYVVEEFPDSDLEEQVIDPSIRRFSKTHQLYANVYPKYRLYSIGMGTIAETTRQSLLTLFDTAGQTTPMVLFLDENNQAILEPIYCVFDDDIGFAHSGGYSWRDKRFKWREVF